MRCALTGNLTGEPGDKRRFPRNQWILGWESELGDDLDGLQKTGNAGGEILVGLFVGVGGCPPGA